MSSDDHQDSRSNALVPRPGTDLAEISRRTNPVIARMTRDVLARAESQGLSTVRYRIGKYVLREPDYRQILDWAEVFSMAPELVLEHLAFVPDDWEPIAFALEDGAITSLIWDFERLPQIPEPWQNGLLIRALRFTARELPGIIALRPSLPMLQTLNCNGFELESLGLSMVPNLTRLNCRGYDGSECESSLIELDLTPVPELTELSCSWNSLTKLDLTSVPGLRKLDCSVNLLTELDLNPVRALTTLECDLNQLTTLNFSPAPGLTKLSCGRNQLNMLDLSPAPGLTELCCWGNQLTELDLSPVRELTKLSCGGNQLAVLDLSPVTGLISLSCSSNYLTELDLTPVPGLTELQCDKSIRLINAPAKLRLKVPFDDIPF